MSLCSTSLILKVSRDGRKIGLYYKLNCKEIDVDEAKLEKKAKNITSKKAAKRLDKIN